MKDAAKEMHGQELGPKTPQEYADYFELAPQRPTFGDRPTTSTGIKHPGHERTWSDTPVSPQGDGNPGPVTPISGGKDGDVPRKRRYSTVDAYTHGRSYDPIQGRVPDEGKVFEPSSATGDPTMYENQGPQTAAFKRPIQIGWEKRYAHALSPDVVVADAATAPNTPQRKKLRMTESK